MNYNDGYSNKPGVQGVEPLSPTFVAEDGITACTFSLDRSLRYTLPGQTDERETDLLSEDFHLLVARGLSSSGTADAIDYHNAERLVAAESVKLDSFKAVGSSSGLSYIRAHGILMILAWTASASSGMLFARYFKNSFK